MAGSKYGRESEQAAATKELAEAWLESKRKNEENWLNAPGREHYVPLDAIRVDETIFCREAINEEAVQRYMANFDSLPEMVVQWDTFKLITGRLRYEAARRLELTVVCVNEVKAADADLWEIAFDSNAENGVPLTYRERMTAARRFIEAHPDWSDARVAERVGVDRSTIFRWRSTPAAAEPAATAVVQLEEPPKRIGKDGRARSATQNKPPKPEKETPAPAADDQVAVPTEGLKDRESDTGTAVAPAGESNGDVHGNRDGYVTVAEVEELTVLPLSAAGIVGQLPNGQDMVSFDVVYEADPFRELVRRVLSTPPSEQADAISSDLTQAALAEGVMLGAWVQSYVDRLKERIVGLVSPGHA